jgi:ferrochelatase
LRFHSQDLTAKVQAALPGVSVKLSMRYGNPSTRAALEEMLREGVERVVVFPLYPQYAASSGGTAVDEVLDVVRRQWNVMPVHVVEPFYDHPAFIAAFTSVLQDTLSGFDADHVLMSFHGVPERHVTRGDVGGKHCLSSETCCASVTQANRFCYRAQCFATARALAGATGLKEGGWSVSFQSRLGRIPWIRPYTDEVLVDLARRGVKKLAVVCPAFVADCLETLEEIGMRAREDFRAAGGDDLRLVPSLNASDAWARAVVSMAVEHAPWLSGETPARLLPAALQRTAPQ